MAEDLKISQLPLVTNPTGAEMIPAAVPGSGGSANTNGKLTLAQVVEKSQAGMVSEDDWNAERKQFTLTGYIANDDGHVVGSDTAWSDVSDLAAGNFSLHTEFIPVNRKYDIKVYSRPTTIHSAVAFYDANQKFISCYKTETTPSDFYEWTYAKADIPADAVFFRLSSYVDKGQKLPWYIHAPNIESREGATSDAIAKSKVALFDDMWLDLGYTLTSIDRKTDPTHPYICNGLPLTYAEAVSTLTEYQLASVPFAYNQRSKIRTNIPSCADGGWQSLDSYAMFSECSNIEVIRIARFGTCNVATLFYTFSNCQKLETIVDEINCTPRSGVAFRTIKAFNKCAKLKDVKIKSLHMDISFADSPLLSLESLQYLVTNAANGTTTITVTVHPDVYAKLSDTSNTEWHKVMTDAAAKSISFATNA